MKTFPPGTRLAPTTPTDRLVVRLQVPGLQPAAHDRERVSRQGPQDGSRIPGSRRDRGGVDTRQDGPANRPLEMQQVKTGRIRVPSLRDDLAPPFLLITALSPAHNLALPKGRQMHQEALLSNWVNAQESREIAPWQCDPTHC